MNQSDSKDVSFERAYQAALQTLSGLRSEETKVSPSLDESLIKKMLVASFANQFEDGTSNLERELREIIEKRVSERPAGGDQR